jgi:hypothetical protein
VFENDLPAPSPCPAVARPARLEALSAGPRKVPGRLPLWGLVGMVAWLSMGCDPNPHGPDAVPPPRSQDSGAAPQTKPDDPMITRD